MSHSLDWMDSAACRDHPRPDDFFPTKTGKPGQLQAKEAAAICAACPVREDCRKHRNRTGASDGVWGGATVRGKTSASAGGPHHLALHGTNAAYNAHRARGEKPCHACWVAHSAKHAPNGRSRWSA